MSRIKSFFTFLLLAVLLSGCGGAPRDVTTADEPVMEPVEPGYYLVSSVGVEGDITFFGESDPENGYLRLNGDHTGTLCFDGVEAALTWDEHILYWRGMELPCACTSYYDPELEREDTMLLIYFTEDMTSVILRPAGEPDAEEAL